MMKEEFGKFLGFVSKVIVIAFCIGWFSYICLRYGYAFEGRKYNIYKQFIDFSVAFVSSHLTLYTFFCLACGVILAGLVSLKDKDDGR